MDYNTQRTKLALPEYGRHIHKMIEWVKSIEDKEKRNEQIKAVVSVMGNLNPHLRDINDFKHKLWDHVQVISHFDIDIVSPYPLPSQETLHEKPRRIPYPVKPIRIRHYGRNTQIIVDNIMSQEEGESKSRQIVALANHMKKVYLLWNKDTVSDEIILRDIGILSNGAIHVDASAVKLANMSYSSHQNNGSGSSSYSNGGKSQQRNGKNGGSNGKMQPGKPVKK